MFSLLSQAANYEFTTLTCIPGIVRYRGAKMQFLDLPGIIEGAKDGKGRGRQVRCHRNASEGEGTLWSLYVKNGHRP